MFGNLLWLNEAMDRLVQSAGGVFIDVLTILLGIPLGRLMSAEVFLNSHTLVIIAYAAIAYNRLNLLYYCRNENC